MVALLGAGFRRSVAATKVGITPQTIRLLIRAGLDAHGEPMPGTFAERVANAEDSVIGSVEEKLYAAAQLGEPWAVTAFLKAKARDEYGDRPAITNVNVGNTLIVEGTAEQRRQSIAALGLELDARRALTQGNAAPPESD